MKETETNIKFSDNDSIADYAKEAVYAMQIWGILYGKDGGYFDPRGLTARAEAAAVFVRICEKLGN